MRMLALPVEVVCDYILPHLSVCDLQALDTAFTNKYLRPQLQQVWKSYQYDSLDVVLNDYDIGWLSRKGARIISCIVKDDVSESNFSMIDSSALKTLRVTFPGVHCATLKLTANCPNIEELCVYEVYGSNTDDAVSALAQNCRQLHTLRMISGQLTDSGIKAIAEYCRNLHTLCIDYSKVTNAGVQALCDNCPHLKHIELSDCHNLTDASLIAIANTYPNLENITLRHVFTDDGLIYFADKCHELRSVSFGYINIRSRGLTALWAANPNLMDVDICRNEFISDDDIFQLVQCCPLLQKLRLSRCDLITDAAVIAVAEHCPQLRSLDIYKYYHASDASLIALGQHCHELKSINISHIRKISDVGVAALAAGCPLLQEFCAKYTYITDAGVVALARGCRDFREINLRGCDLIGIGAVTAIAEICPLLSTLTLSECNKVDNACLYVIAQHCRNLTYLSVTTTKVSDVDAIISIIKSCRMLREFYFDYSVQKYEYNPEYMYMSTIQKYAGSRVNM